MQTPIDLRSDTVTKPTQAMRDAMHSAPLGDDVMQTDPTVIELEEKAASLFDKQAALFVPSGTMSNLLAILSQTRSGDEILLNDQSHIFYYEAGGYAALAGCSVKFIQDTNPTKPGLFSSQALRDSIRGPDIHFPTPSLLTIENTHNRGGGVCWPIDQLNDVCNTAHESGLRVHIDGARIWNASIATGESLQSLALNTDSISVCLSKGLGCPVGSLLIADQQTVDTARHKRKMLGGAMRQAGVIASAGIYALDHHIQRLDQDHQRAQTLAQSIEHLPLFDFNSSSVETNLVYAKLSSKAITTKGDAFIWEKVFENAGILCFAESKHTLRFVTHLDLNNDQLHKAIEIIRSIADAL